VQGPDWAERYAYDPAGNVAAARWPAESLGGGQGLGGVVGLGGEGRGPRRITGTLVTRAGNVRYRHDRQGRVVQRQVTRISRRPDVWHYQWDASDRLTAVTTPNGTGWQYRYDPFGRRIAKQRLGPDGAVVEQTDFTWDGPVLAEQSSTMVAGRGGRGGRMGERGAGEDGAGGSGGSPGEDGAAEDGAGASGTGEGAGSTGERSGWVVTWNYRPGSFTPLTQSEHIPAADLAEAPQEQIDRRFYAIVTDLVGSPTELAGPDGTLAGHQQHTLWGHTAWRGAASTPLRFPGQYADPETGLHYNQHRYYDPEVGAYLTPDPLGLAAAPNPHAYVMNPQVLSDPLGLAPYDATGSESNGGLGDLKPVDERDPGAHLLAQRIEGEPSVRFANGPYREFDAVSDQYVAQAKPANFRLSQAWRRQAKATFKVSIQSGRIPYFQFDGPPDPDVLQALSRYAERYGVQPVIDLNPLGGN
jgi:RHS repeat-associated protein